MVTAGAASPTIAAAIGLTEAAIASASAIAVTSASLAYTSYTASNAVGRVSPGPHGSGITAMTNPSSPLAASTGSSNHLTSFGPHLPTEAEIAASDLPLEESWGPDDAIFALTGLGVSARAAMTAARQLGPAVLGGLRALGETGAIRVGRPLTTNAAIEVSETVLSNSTKTIVIGETMDRVNSYARSIGAKWYQAWRIEPFDEALALKRNERWIRGVIRKGYRIIDIGIDTQRAVRSKFYGLERRIIEELGYAVTRR